MQKKSSTAFGKSVSLRSSKLYKVVLSSEKLVILEASSITDIEGRAINLLFFTTKTIAKHGLGGRIRPASIDKQIGANDACRISARYTTGQFSKNRRYYLTHR